MSQASQANGESRRGLSDQYLREDPKVSGAENNRPGESVYDPITQSVRGVCRAEGQSTWWRRGPWALGQELATTHRGR